MTADHPELTDEQFENFLEQVGEALDVPSLHSSTDIALARIGAEYGATASGRVGPPDGAGWGPDERPLAGRSERPLYAPRSRWRELSIFAAGALVASAAALVLVLVFRGFPSDSESDSGAAGGALTATAASFSTSFDDGATGSEPSGTPQQTVVDDPRSGPERAVVMSAWSDDEGRRMMIVDPLTGLAHPEAAPVPQPQLGSGVWPPQTLSADGSLLALIESEGTVSEPAGIGTSSRARADRLTIVDVPTWSRVTTELPGGFWAGASDFDLDKGRFVLALNRAEDSRIVLVDSTSGEILAEAELAFRPLVVRYVGGGSQIAVYGQARGEAPGTLQPPPPQFAALHPDSLDTIWEEDLPDILSGIWNVDQESATDPNELPDYYNWTPGTTTSPDGWALYIVHADADMLTTVDFKVQGIETRPIDIGTDAPTGQSAGTPSTRSESGWSEFGVARESRLAPDRSALYVLTRESNGTRDVEDDLLRLQVIELAGLRIVASRTLEAGITLRVISDGDYILLSWLGEDPFSATRRHWSTAVLRADTLDTVASYEGWNVAATMRLDGTPVLVALRQDWTDERSMLAVVSSETFLLSEPVGIPDVILDILSPDFP